MLIKNTKNLKKKNKRFDMKCFIQVKLVENGVKVKVPVISFKHFASPEVYSRTMLCNITFSSVSLSLFLFVGQPSRKHSLVLQHKQDQQR